MKFIAKERAISPENYINLKKFEHEEVVHMYNLIVSNIVKDMQYDEDHKLLLVIECNCIKTAEGIIKKIPSVQKGLKMFDIFSLQ